MAGFKLDDDTAVREKALNRCGATYGVGVANLQVTKLTDIRQNGKKRYRAVTIAVNGKGVIVQVFADGSTSAPR